MAPARRADERTSRVRMAISASACVAAMVCRHHLQNQEKHEPLARHSNSRTVLMPSSCSHVRLKWHALFGLRMLSRVVTSLQHHAQTHGVSRLRSRAPRAFSVASKMVIDYDSYLTETALSRKPSPIRALVPLTRLPGRSHCDVEHLWCTLERATSGHHAHAHQPHPQQPKRN